MAEGNEGAGEESSAELRYFPGGEGFLPKAFEDPNPPFSRLMISKGVFPMDDEGMLAPAKKFPNPLLPTPLTCEKN